VPVLMEEDGAKLSKSRRSLRLDQSAPLEQLLAVFSLLGLHVPRSGEFCSIRAAWQWATGQWSINKVPKRLKLTIKG
jgi:hypothetical protein